MNSYQIENFNRDTFIEMPLRNDVTSSYLYYKPLIDEIYPKIYKNEHDWQEYCVFDGNNQPFYAKQGDGKPYYPTDSKGRTLIIMNHNEHPVFIDHLEITFIHLQSSYRPFQNMENDDNEFKKFKNDYILYHTKADHSVGILYINEMTLGLPRTFYEDWRFAGITDEWFARTDRAFGNSDVFTDKKGRTFIFVKIEKFYVDLDKYCFVEPDTGLNYDLDARNQKLYFVEPDRRYFVVRNRTEQHFILASSDAGLRAYQKASDHKLNVYFPDLPDGFIRSISIDFDLETMKQELDRRGNVICHLPDGTYFWYEHETLVFFDYVNGRKERYSLNDSGEKRYFKFLRRGSDVKIKFKGENQLHDLVYEEGEEFATLTKPERQTNYKIEKLDDETFIETSPDGSYYAPFSDQVYPRIYKNEREWTEYCLSFYAKENGKPYYPVDSQGRTYVLMDHDDKPVFVKGSKITPVHLDEITMSGKRMFRTKADLSVGAFYLSKLNKSGTFKNYDLFVGKEGSFVFVRDQRHYVSGNHFVEPANPSFTYDLDFARRKLYRMPINNLDTIYFVIRDRKKIHYVLASGEEGLYAYRTESDERVSVYFPDFPDLPLQTLNFDFKEMGQELDENLCVVCFFRNGEKKYFRYERGRLVYLNGRRKFRKGFAVVFFVIMCFVVFLLAWWFK